MYLHAHWVHIHLKSLYLLHRSLDHYLMPFFVYRYSIFLKSILSNMSTGIPDFFSFPFVQNTFYSFHFQSVCDFRSEVGLL